MKPILIFPCGEVTEPDCGIVGKHMDEKEAIAFLNAHPYYLGKDGQTPTVMGSVDLQHFYVRKKNIEQVRDDDLECEGKYAWCRCDKMENGAKPYTEVTICEYGD